MPLRSELIRNTAPHYNFRLLHQLLTQDTDAPRMAHGNEKHFIVFGFGCKLYKFLMRRNSRNCSSKYNNRNVVCNFAKENVAAAAALLLHGDAFICSVRSMMCLWPEWLRSVQVSSRHEMITHTFYCFFIVLV